jgi:hypothetical protein
MLIAMATQEVLGPARTAVERTAEAVRGNRTFGNTLNQAMRTNEGLVSEIAAVDAEVSRIVDSARNIVRHSPHNEGVLHAKALNRGIIPLDARGVPVPHSRISDTFRSGSYLTYETTKSTKLYRVFSAPDEVGHQSGFWTKVKPTSATQSMIDSALEPSWGNQATKWIEIEVPVGRTLHEGVAAPIQRVGDNMSEFLGGGNQVYLDFEVSLEWISNRGGF